MMAHALASTPQTPAMTSTSSPASTMNSLQTYIHIAEDFIDRCEKIPVQGIHKLKKKCQSELKFLQSLHGRAKVTTHLKSSNLGHFAAVLHCVENLPHPTTVLKPFPYPGRESLSVDVIGGQGHLWFKVIARKAQALHLVWAGQGHFGEKTLIDQAQEYLRLATFHLVNFRAPRLCYTFYSGITKPMAAALEELGILVIGELVDVSLDVQTKLSSLKDLDLDSNSDLGNSELEISSGSEDDLEEGNSGKILMCGNCDAVNPKQKAVADERIDFAINVRKDGQSQGKLGAKTSANVGHQTSTVESSKQSENSDKLDGERSSACSEVAETLIGKETFLHTVQTSPLTSDPKESPDQRNSDRNSSSKSPISPSLMKYYFFEGTVMSIKLKNLFHMSTDSFGNSFPSSQSSKSPVIFDPSPVKEVNLDVTALIALISAVTHGQCYFIFEDDVLSEQAAEERRCPLLPKMKEFLQGKDLFTCQSAVTAFNSILHTLGGPAERARAAELMRQVTVVPDCPSGRTQKLPTSSKIKHRSKVIFGTGDELMMVTLTANSGFVRAAKNQGVNYTVFIHAARALTEAKEKGARKIEVTDVAVT